MNHCDLTGRAFQNKCQDAAIFLLIAKLFSFGRWYSSSYRCKVQLRWLKKWENSSGTSLQLSCTPTTFLSEKKFFGKDVLIICGKDVRGFVLAAKEMGDLNQHTLMLFCCSNCVVADTQQANSQALSSCLSQVKAWEHDSYTTSDKPELNTTVSDSQSNAIFNLFSLVTRYLDTLEYLFDASCLKISLFTEVRSVWQM